jgi:hypothetical protein
MRLIFSELKYQSEGIGAENGFLILGDWIRGVMKAGF